MRTKCLILFIAILLPAQESTDLLDGPGWLSRGVEAYKSGKLQPAAEAFQKAIEMNPGDVAPHLYLASTWMSQYMPGTASAKNLEFSRRAESEYLQVLGIDPENKVAIRSLGSLTFQQAESMPDSPDKTRKLEAARAWYENLVRLEPEQNDAYHSLGVIAWSTWYPKWAAARAQCGMKNGAPGPISDAAVRAQLKDQFGSIIENGIFNLQKALEADPDSQDALRYMELLVRTRADLRDTPEEYARDIQAADQWMQKGRQNQAQSAGLTAAVLSDPGASEGALLDPAHHLVPIKGVVLVRRVDPVYPPAAGEAGIEGTVRFRVMIGKDGRVRSLQLVSGHPLLVSAARDAVQQWEYMPTLLNNAPVEVVTDISLSFAIPVR